MSDISKNLPLIHILRAVDELTKRAVPYQQTLLYAENMLPEYIECAYKTKLLIAKTYSLAHNTAILWGDEDTSSSVKLACYNLEYFLNAALDKIKSLYDNRRIEITIDTLGCKKVLLDIRRTSLILFNLISNAVIHSNVKEKQITISARLEDNNFILSVRDNGKGIPKTQIKNLFSSYENKLTNKKLYDTGGGLFNFGTGLAVSLKAAKEMNGNLSYIPTNTGAKFELVIPQRDTSSIGEVIDYMPSIQEVEEYLADSLLMFCLEDEKNN